MHTPVRLTLGLLLLSASIARGDEPRPIPLTRPEMKQLLEDMKGRKPRIPLPALTDEEKEKLGERGAGYESRLRTLYLPAGEGFGFGGGGRTNAGATAKAAGAPAQGAAPGGGFGRNSDPNMTLDYAFKTELFWIVSRSNNCQYCLGHQESKLLGAGRSESDIAALDGDWSEFSPAQKAAFAFARKYTYQPHLFNDGDIDELRKHYKDLQILEMILSMAGNNAINRWKEGAGIPQSAGGGNFGSRRPDGTAVAEAKTAPAAAHSYLTPTADAVKDRISKVAPIRFDAKSGLPTRATVSERPALLESREAVERALEVARHRTSRLPLVDEVKARELVSDAFPQGPLPNWVRLVAHFPREGMNRVTNIKAAEEKGDLTPLLKAQVSWIIARQDRTWYALGQSLAKLKELGQSADQIAALDGDWSGFSPAERAQFTLARKLSASPVVLTDDDVTNAVKLTSPRDVVQLISYTTTRASFDRITESAGLPLEK